MIHRFDNLAVDLPDPIAPNPVAAAAVQELMGENSAKCPRS